jgi:hypothetical protein
MNNNNQNYLMNLITSQDESSNDLFTQLYLPLESLNSSEINLLDTSSRRKRRRPVSLVDIQIVHSYTVAIKNVPMISETKENAISLKF